MDYGSSKVGTLHVVQTSSLYGSLRVAEVGLTRVSVRLSLTLRFRLFLKFHILKISLLEWFYKFVVVQPPRSHFSKQDSVFMPDAIL